MTKNQLKEQIRKIIRQQLKEQIEEPYPSRDTARDEDFRIANKAIDNWFETNQKSWKFQEDMFEWAIESLQHNAESDYKWFPDEQVAIKHMFEKFDSDWTIELLQYLSDEYGSRDLEVLVENHDELLAKISHHIKLVCEKYAKTMFDNAADKLDEMYN